MQERLWSAYVYSLSSLQQEWFPDLDAREWFDEIMASLTRYSEATEGAGSVPTTLWTMPDDEAEATASRIRRLADKYLA